MRAGLEKNLVRRALGALLLSVVLLVAGATAAAADGYGTTYPVPSVPPGTPDEPPPSPPPVLARTGSSSAPMIGVGLGAVAVGGGLVVFARRRRLATVPA